MLLPTKKEIQSHVDTSLKRLLCFHTFSICFFSFLSHFASVTLSLPNMRLLAGGPHYNFFVLRRCGWVFVNTGAQICLLGMNNWWFSKWFFRRVFRCDINCISLSFSQQVLVCFSGKQKKEERRKNWVTSILFCYLFLFTSSLLLGKVK